MIMQGPVLQRVEVTVWATPGEGVGLDEAVSDAIAAGNTIIEVDHGNRRFLLAHIIEES